MIYLSTPVCLPEGLTELELSKKIFKGIKTQRKKNILVQYMLCDGFLKIPVCLIDASILGQWGSATEIAAGWCFLTFFKWCSIDKEIFSKGLEILLLFVMSMPIFFRKVKGQVANKLCLWHILMDVTFPKVLHTSHTPEKSEIWAKNDVHFV